jgi:alkylation response protein AidB-like acyl-CoA dehydrogenase
MDLFLDERMKSLQNRARRFFEEVLAPMENIVDEHGEVPLGERARISEAVRSAGFGGINHSIENGGQGLTIFEQVLVNEQIGRATNGNWTT